MNACDRTPTLTELRWNNSTLLHGDVVSIQLGSFASAEPSEK